MTTTTITDQTFADLTRIRGTIDTGETRKSRRNANRYTKPVSNRLQYLLIKDSAYLAYQKLFRDNKACGTPLPSCQLTVNYYAEVSLI